MHWKLVVAAALVTLSTSVLADERGDALVQGWLARIPTMWPITADFTTTYTIGKTKAVYKDRTSLSDVGYSSTCEAYQCDDAYPFDLYRDFLRDNLDPLPNKDNLAHLDIWPAGKASYTRYLGKETVSGIVYDVVEVRENLAEHISRSSPMQTSFRDKHDGRIAIKWYLDGDGTVRRMTFSAQVRVPDTYISLQSVFTSPITKVSGTLLKTATAPASVRPDSTETFTATTVVDDLGKTRPAPVRTVLQAPLFIVPESSNSNCVFSPDGKQLAVRGRDTLKVISTTDWHVQYTLNNPGGEGLLLDFSADGKSLALADAAGPKVVRTEDGKLIRAIATTQKYPNCLRLSTDGKRIAVIGERPEVEIWNVESGVLEHSLKDNGRVSEAMFSTDGRRLVCAGYLFDILIWDTNTWRMVDRLPHRSFSGQPIALSRDGKYIAAVDNDNNVLVWDGAGKTPVKKLKGAVGRIHSLTFSTDGKQLYAGDCDELSDTPTLSPGCEGWNVETGVMTADFVPWRWDSMLWAGRGVVSADGRFAAFSGSPSPSDSVVVFSLPAGK